MTEQPPQLAFFVDAFEHSVRSLLAVAGELRASEWDRPTDLPGWSVRDVVAHLAAVESELLGEPGAAALDSYGPHVRDEFGRHMEDGVVARRGRQPHEVVAELAAALDRRLPQMRAMSTDDPPVRVPAGQRWDTATLLRNRAFDAWMHEQDVRRAAGRPGNLDGPGAQLARLVLLGALPYLVAKRAGARPGQTVRLAVTGAVSFDVLVAVDASGRAALVEDATATLPTAGIETDWVSAVRLFGGRARPEAVTTRVEGDRDLAGRLLAGLAVTP